MTFKKVIAGLSSVVCTCVLAMVVSLFSAVAPAQVASASGGNCKWEGGPGDPTYPACKTEDCDGRGGTAVCTGGQGAPSPGSGPDGWIYGACDEAAPQMWRIAAWCVAAGGTWITTSSDPRCEGAGPGGGTSSASESTIMSTATNFANGMLGSCGAHQTSDTGWGTTLPPTSLCSPGGSAFQLGVIYRSVRQKVYEANSPCTGSLAISFAKNRGVKCPPPFRARHAVTGEECWTPKECCQIGNPVSPMSGAKGQAEVDYVAPGDVGLELIRYYNSTAYMRPINLTTTFDNADNVLPSEYWRRSYDQHLYLVTGNAEISAIYQGADGFYRSYNTAGQETGNLGGAGSTLQASGSYWNVTLPNRDVERFDAGGKLVSITTATGRVTTINQVGCTRVVTGPFGHTLTLTYDCSDPQRLLSATLPDGGVIQYAYDEYDRPTTVTYPDLTTKTYEHTDPRNQWLLTGIRDANNQLFAQYAYDAQGRAVSTQHAGGAEAYSVSYPNETTSIVTDPAGKTTQYTFAPSGGAMRLSGLSEPCMDCDGVSSTVFDVQGNPSSRTAFDGTQTLFTYDPVRNLETWRTEAAGTPEARVITTEWHPVFREPTQIDQPGHRKVFTYDSGGQALTRTETDLATSVSRTWTYTYNSVGQMLTMDGPRSDVNDVVTFTYNSCTSGSGCGQLATQTDPAGNTTTYLTYDANGNPLTVSDSNGLVTTYTYDARSRVTSIARGTEVSTIEYWPTGLVKKSTRADGSYIAYSYDAAHRLTGITDGLGNSLSYTLDAAGNVIAESMYDGTNTLFRSSSRNYDALNQLQSETGASSQTTTYDYDAVGNRIATTDPLDRLTTFEFDALRRLKAATDPIGGTSQYTYDARGNTLSVTDPRQLQTGYVYNGFDEMTSSTSPDSGSHSFVNDASGQVQSQDARGADTHYTRDAAGRLTQIEYDDQTVHFVYDTEPNGHGHLGSMTDASGSMQFAHDAHGRVTSITQTTGTLVRTVGQTYNTAGQLETRTLPSGAVVSYTYANGRITGISVNGTVLLSNVLYAPFGPTLGWQWGNGTYSVREYDLDGRITSIDSAGLTTFTYNADGTIQSRQDDAPSPSSAANGSLLINVSTTSNRVASTTAVASSATRAYTYDSAGNLTGDGLHTFTYDGAGRLSSSMVGGTPTAYTYNGFGQRVKKVGPAGTFYFVYDEDGHLLGQYDSAGALVEELVWLDNIPVATLRTSPSGGIGFFYIHTDNVNAPMRLTRTSDNAIMWRWDHDPYGQGAPDEDADGNGAFVFFNGRFPGQIYDPESGLHYNYFRDYDPQTGRYVESDPIGLKGGLNTYAYANGRPVSLIDPRGLYSLGVGSRIEFVDSIPGNAWRWVAQLRLANNAIAVTKAFLGQSRCSCVNCGSYWKLSECSNHLDIRVIIDNELTDHATQSAFQAEADHIFDFKAGASRIRKVGKAAEAVQKQRTFSSKSDCERESSAAVTAAVWAERDAITMESASTYDRSGNHNYRGGDPYR